MLLLVRRSVFFLNKKLSYFVRFQSIQVVGYRVQAFEGRFFVETKRKFHRNQILVLLNENIHGFSNVLHPTLSNKHATNQSYSKVDEMNSLTFFFILFCASVLALYLRCDQMNISFLFSFVLYMKQIRNQQYFFFLLFQMIHFSFCSQKNNNNNN